PSCGDLVRALRNGAAEVVAVAPPGSAATPEPAARRTPTAEPGAPDSSAQAVPEPDMVPVARVVAMVAAEPPARPTPPPVQEEPLPPEPPEVAGDGVLFPALVVGLGVAGREILRHLRKVLHKRCCGDTPPHVRFLLVDADAEDLHEATLGEADSALCESE